MRGRSNGNKTGCRMSYAYCCAIRVSFTITTGVRLLNETSPLIANPCCALLWRAIVMSEFRCFPGRQSVVCLGSPKDYRGGLRGTILHKQKFE